MDPAPRQIFRRIVALALGVRLALEALGLASVAAGGSSPWSRGLSMWSQWDAPHYLRIAEVGYRRFGMGHGDDPLFIVFFPFFPLAVRIVAIVARDLVLSGLLVSFASSVGAMWFLYRLVAIDGGHREGWRAVLLLCACPTGYYLAAPYSEALFLFAVLASMYAARTGRWVRSGLAGALATGTRVAGVALAPALMIEAFSTPARTSRRFRRLAGIAPAAVGVLVYLALNQIVHGSAFRFLKVQRSHWYQRPVPPWQTIVDAIGGLTRGTNSSTEVFIFWGRLAGFALAVALLIAGTRKLRLSDAAYAWGGLVLVLSTTWLLSLPRYLIALYPLFIIGARLTKSARVFWPATVAMSAMQGWFFWRYASGAWTF